MLQSLVAPSLLNRQLGQLQVGSVPLRIPLHGLAEATFRLVGFSLEEIGLAEPVHELGVRCPRHLLGQVLAGVVKAAAPGQVIGEMHPEHLARCGHLLEFRVELQDALECRHGLLRIPVVMINHPPQHEADDLAAGDVAEAIR